MRLLCALARLLAQRDFFANVGEPSRARGERVTPWGRATRRARRVGFVVGACWDVLRCVLRGGRGCTCVVVSVCWPSTIFDVVERRARELARVQSCCNCARVVFSFISDTHIYTNVSLCANEQTKKTTTSQRLLTARSQRVKSVDIHPREPWVLAALFDGKVYIWNFQTQALVKSFEIIELPGNLERVVFCFLVT